VKNRRSNVLHSSKQLRNTWSLRVFQISLNL
jgi:hypothetical protein